MIEEPHDRLTPLSERVLLTVTDPATVEEIEGQFWSFIQNGQAVECRDPENDLVLLTASEITSIARSAEVPFEELSADEIRGLYQSVVDRQAHARRTVEKQVREVTLPWQRRLEKR